MLDKQELQSLGFQEQANQNPLLEYLKAHYPNTLHEDGSPNLKTLKLALDIKENLSDKQGYELSFTGKGLANALYNSPCAKELQFIAHQSPCQDASNIIIRGDNLDALKLLKQAYYEKIKLIYIDPPYNTKNDNFIYPDNFREDYKALLKEVGLVSTDEEGRERESELVKFFKNGTRTHSAWLCFMLPRLKLARDLLREDGVIFISIDDNEQANLKLLCDEVFGEENLCGQMIWLKGNAQNDADTIQSNHEYILAYAKNIEFKPFNKIKQEVKVKAFKDEKTGKFYYEGAGLTTGGAGGVLNARVNLGFSIYYNPKTQDFLAKDDYDKELAKVSNSESEVYKNDENLIQRGYIPIRPPKKGAGLGCWTWALEKFNDEKERIIIRKNSKGYIILKKEWLDSKKIKQDENGEFYAVIEKENPPKSFIDFAGSGSGTSDLKSVLGAKVFNNPKNVKLIKHLLKISTTPNNATDGGESDSQEPEIVLDFFAGSGTTAHAVLDLNREDGGKRQFILVQLDEEIKESKSKSAYDFCKNELKSPKPVISDITIERVKRAAKALGLSPDFSVYTLEPKAQIINEPNALALTISSLSPYDRAKNLALQSAKTLDKKLETILENRLYRCEDACYLVGCDEEVLRVIEGLDFKQDLAEGVFVSAYEDISLQDFLNLKSKLGESNLKVIY